MSESFKAEIMNKAPELFICLLLLLLFLLLLFSSIKVGLSGESRCFLVQNGLEFQQNPNSTLLEVEVRCQQIWSEWKSCRSVWNFYYFVTVGFLITCFLSSLRLLSRHSRIRFHVWVQICGRLQPTCVVIKLICFSLHIFFLSFCLHHTHTHTHTLSDTHRCTKELG